MEPRILRIPLTPDEWKHIAASVADFLKVVVDVRRGVLALGGELHADGEQVLLDDGSQASDLWGANVYPNQPKDRQLEYDSMINISPRRGNRSSTIELPEVRVTVEKVIRSLLPLP